ncbi:hypothetical protein [Streptomyces sp. NPDC056524]|uniref:hypothetical protein n=1 Tax=Streptomyces sp. NPDC056524 TaxID=3345851 RepID=UPI0036C08649
MAEFHDMTTGGQGSTSRFETAGQQDPTESASRNHAARRRREIAESYAAVSHNDVMQGVYEERAAQKEADQRELEKLRTDEKANAERRKRKELGARWDAEDGHTVDRDSSLADQLAAARKSHDEFTLRSEGEELAARIAAGVFAPWTR